MHKFLEWLRDVREAFAEDEAIAQAQIKTPEERAAWDAYTAQCEENAYREWRKTRVIPEPFRGIMRPSPHKET